MRRIWCAERARCSPERLHQRNAITRSGPLIPSRPEIRRARSATLVHHRSVIGTVDQPCRPSVARTLTAIGGRPRLLGDRGYRGSREHGDPLARRDHPRSRRHLLGRRSDPQHLVRHCRRDGGIDSWRQRGLLDRQAFTTRSRSRRLFSPPPPSLPLAISSIGMRTTSSKPLNAISRAPSSGPRSRLAANELHQSHSKVRREARMLL